MALPRRSIATAEIAKAALTHDGRAACRNTLAHSPIHGETRFLRDALPDPEKQRLSPATQQLITPQSYRRVSEPLSKDEFPDFFDFWSCNRRLALCYSADSVEINYFKSAA
jgi:hypothetical protein